MKVLVIDDEVHCRNVVVKMLTAHCPEITSISEANSVQGALQKLKSEQPDIIFLDIQLNDLTGFDLLNQVQKINFQIVFITAYDNFAIKAFEYAAVHYLLKPVAPSDIIEALKRCANQELLYKKELIEKTSGFYLRTHENSYDVIFEQIKYIKADRSYSTIFNDNGQNIFTSKKLADYSGLLSEDFYRIHNSIIVNMNFVKKIHSSGLQVVLTDETNLPISRRRKTEFKTALNLFKQFKTKTG